MHRFITEMTVIAMFCIKNYVSVVIKRWKRIRNEKQKKFILSWELLKTDGCFLEVCSSFSVAHKVIGMFSFSHSGTYMELYCFSSARYSVKICSHSKYKEEWMFHTRSSKLLETKKRWYISDLQFPDCSKSI